MKTTSIQVVIVGLLLVFFIGLVARFTFLGDSLFDPAVAPGLGPLALGDLLVIAVIAGGYMLFRLKKQP